MYFLKPRELWKKKNRIPVVLKFSRHSRKWQVKVSRFYPFSMKTEIRMPQTVNMVNTNLSINSKMKVYTKAPTFPVSLGLWMEAKRKKNCSLWNRSLRESKESSGGECGRLTGLMSPTVSMCDLTNVSEMGWDHVQLSDSVPLAHVSF